MIKNKQFIIAIFAFFIFSILMMVQIDIDANTNDDFKINGIINTSCAQSLDDPQWASCTEGLGSGRYSGIWCSTCKSRSDLPQGSPNLCKKEADSELGDN